MVLLKPTTSDAIIYRHDIPASAYNMDPSDYPYVTDLRVPDDCAATPLNAEWALTVAHCTVDITNNHELSEPLGWA
jgi:hypothetical protein